MGSADFIRVPLPAARTTRWMSGITHRIGESGPPGVIPRVPRGPRLAARCDAGAGGGGAGGRGFGARRFDESLEGGVVAQAVKLRVLARERPVLRIQRDGLPQVLDGAIDLVPARGGDADHVMRVIVPRILLQGALQVAERGGLVPGVEGHGRGVDPLVGRLRRWFLWFQLPLA